MAAKAIGHLVVYIRITMMAFVGLTDGGPKS